MAYKVSTGGMTRGLPVHQNNMTESCLYNIVIISGVHSVRVTRNSDNELPEPKKLPEISGSKFGYPNFGYPNRFSVRVPENRVSNNYPKLLPEIRVVNYPNLTALIDT